MKKCSIRYKGVGFWAYDVSVGIFLKHLIDVANHQLDAGKHRWLEECVKDWRIYAVLCGSLGVNFDESWSNDQLDVVASLIDEACELLGQRQYISAKETKSWNILDGKGIGTRGTANYPTRVVVELGNAIKDLIQGNLLPAPEGYWLYYGTPIGLKVGPPKDVFPFRKHYRNELYRSRLDSSRSYSVQVFGAIPEANSMAEYCVVLSKRQDLLAETTEQSVSANVTSFCEEIICSKIVLAVTDYQNGFRKVRAVSNSPLEVYEILDDLHSNQLGMYSMIEVYFCGPISYEILEVSLSTDDGCIVVARYQMQKDEVRVSTR